MLSLCAGEARDLAGAALGHPRAADVRGVAVELNAGLAAIAAQSLRATGTAVEVRCADAGRPIHWDDVLPVDLLLLAGIFGNLTDEHVRAHRGRDGVDGASRRHHRLDPAPQGARPHAQYSWMVRRRRVHPGGLHVGQAPTRYAVGVERMDEPRPGAPLPEQLFRFVDA